MTGVTLFGSRAKNFWLKTKAQGYNSLNQNWDPWAMEFNSRLDLTTVFCEVDDFCKKFDFHWEEQLKLTAICGEKISGSRLNVSEVMTIALAFVAASGYRTFKDFYTLLVLSCWREAFPNLVSYNRFVELMPRSLMSPCCFLDCRRGENTGISFIDSTPIEVCHPRRLEISPGFWR